jgi:ATP-dependent DNA helicase PIF1
MRLQPGTDNEQYSRWLLDIGHGRNVDQDGNTNIPSQMVTFEEETLIHDIYHDISESNDPPPPEYFLNHAILAPRNTDVQDTNEKILSRMPGEVITYHSADSFERVDTTNFGYGDVPQDFLHALHPPSLPLSELNMKIGCPLILLRNLDPSQGLCNGTRMVLRHAYRRLLEVEIIGGDHHKQKAFIPRITLKQTTIPSFFNDDNSLFA